MFIVFSFSQNQISALMLPELSMAQWCISREYTQATTGLRFHDIFLLYRCSEDPRKDPRNRSVSIIDYFQYTKDDTISYFDMPCLRRMDDPEFGSVEEMLAFGD